MKQIFLICSILLFSVNLFSQRLEDKETSNLDHNTLFAVQDSTNKYNWKKIDFKSLSETFNPFRTSYGNVTSVDSSGILHGFGIHSNHVLGANRLHNLSNISVGSETDFSQTWSSRKDKSITYLRSDGLVGNSGVTDHATSIEAFNYSNKSLSSNDIIMQLGGVWEYDTTDAAFAYNNRITSAIHLAKNDDKGAVFISDYFNATASYDNIEQNSYVGFYEDSTVVNNVIEAKSGIKLGELSYFPASNDDIQAEAITAEIGTKWRKEYGGQFYEIHKTEANRVVRVLISEGESGGNSEWSLVEKKVVTSDIYSIEFNIELGNEYKLVFRGVKDNSTSFAQSYFEIYDGTSWSNNFDYVRNYAGHFQSVLGASSPLNSFLIKPQTTYSGEVVFYTVGGDFYSTFNINGYNYSDDKLMTTNGAFRKTILSDITKIRMNATSSSKDLTQGEFILYKRN